MPRTDAEWLPCIDAVAVKHYRFWTENGRAFKLYVEGDRVRCIVPTQGDAVVRGEVAWRDSQGRTEPDSRRTHQGIVTIGAVLPTRMQWQE